MVFLMNYRDTKDIAVSCFKQMKTNEEILDAAAIKASEILGVPHTHLDKTMFLYFFTLLHERFGGDEELMRHWIDTYNKHLNFCPGVQLTDNVTLDKVIAYLESFNK